MFLDARLPEAVETGAKRIDDEDVEIQASDDGTEFRNVRSSQGLLEFDVSWPISCRDDDDYVAARALFKVARKALHTFRFRDFSAYQAIGEVLGVGDGVTADYQLGVTSTVDGEDHVHQIYLPTNPVQILKDGVVTAGWTVDYDTGVLTLTTPASWDDAEISWTGEYDLLVRFDSPLVITWSNSEQDKIESVSIVEVRPAPAA